MYIQSGFRIHDFKALDPNLKHAIEEALKVLAKISKQFQRKHTVPY
jgi:hypothetical protein